MFDAIGHTVLKLRRIRIGFLADRLAPGQWRFLTDAEISRLMNKRKKERALQKPKARGASHGGRRS
jgi:23S rRNA pseudouridine2605 synthase